MTDKKVNLQDLFDGQVNQSHRKHYTASQEQRGLLSKRALERVYSTEELDAMRERQKQTPTARLKTLQEKDFLTEEEKEELKVIKEKIWLRDQYRRGVPLTKEHREALIARIKARAGTPLEQAHRDNQSKAAKERWATNPYKPTAEVIEKRRQAQLKSNAEKRAAMPPKEVEPPKKRGRPKTRPERDPNLPKRGRGRPPKVL